MIFLHGSTRFPLAHQYGTLTLINFAQLFFITPCINSVDKLYQPFKGFKGSLKLVTVVIEMDNEITTTLLKVIIKIKPVHSLKLCLLVLS